MRIRILTYGHGLGLECGAGKKKESPDCTMRLRGLYRAFGAFLVNLMSNMDTVECQWVRPAGTVFAPAGFDEVVAREWAINDLPICHSHLDAPELPDAAAPDEAFVSYLRALRDGADHCIIFYAPDYQDMHVATQTWPRLLAHAEETEVRIFNTQQCRPSSLPIDIKAKRRSLRCDDEFFPEHQRNTPVFVHTASE